MSYFLDLDTASLVGHGERHRAIGWLSRGHDFSHGSVDEEFLGLLRRHVATAFQPLAFGGGHVCEFCGNFTAYGNLWIPTLEFIYVAPEMIVHYITKHGYKPPLEFCNAVRSCPPQGSPDYMSLFTAYFFYFRTTPPEAPPNPEQKIQLARLLDRGLNEIAVLCRQGDARAAAALASACAEIPAALHGWGLWYRHVFSRLVRNGRTVCPTLDHYREQYNSIFGGDTDPELTLIERQQANLDC